MNKNEFKKLFKKVKAISTKELKKDLMNKFSILNEAKYFFFRNISKLFSICTCLKNIKYFSGLLELIHGYLREFLKKILKI